MFFILVQLLSWYCIVLAVVNQLQLFNKSPFIDRERDIDSFGAKKAPKRSSFTYTDGLGLFGKVSLWD